MMVPTSDKYLVWVTDTQGEYVRATGVREENDTVLFMMGEAIIRSFTKEDIVDYKKVEDS